MPSCDLTSLKPRPLAAPPRSRAQSAATRHSSFVIHHSPRAFTIIEILVVVSIIVLLVGIIVSASAVVKRQSAMRSTRTTLKMLSQIMHDYLASGNPEPQAPALGSWPYASPPREYEELKFPSDITGWVRALRATPQTATKLNELKSGQDLLTPPNRIILDGFGFPIRYIPNTIAIGGRGYFLSAGPDGVFVDTNTNPLIPPVKDDVSSLDAN